MTFKTITIKKRGGGTRKQKVKVLASGKFRFVKNSSSSKSTKRKTSRKSRVTRRKVTRVINKIKPRRIMTKRRRSSTKRTSSKGIMSTVKRFAKPIAIGLGTGSVIAIAGNALGQPQLASNKLIGAGAAFLLGGPVAGGAALLLGGGLGGLSNLFGGNGGNTRGMV